VAGRWLERAKRSLGVVAFLAGIAAIAAGDVAFGVFLAAAGAALIMSSSRRDSHVDLAAVRRRLLAATVASASCAGAAVVALVLVRLQLVPRVEVAIAAACSSFLAFKGLQILNAVRTLELCVDFHGPYRTACTAVRRRYGNPCLVLADDKGLAIGCGYLRGATVTRVVADEVAGVEPLGLTGVCVRLHGREAITLRGMSVPCASGLLTQLRRLNGQPSTG
jgi:hypothetical protein